MLELHRGTKALRRAQGAVGEFHGFIGGDQSHPQSAEINEKLDELRVKMK